MKIRYEDGQVPESSRSMRLAVASQLKEARQDAHLTQEALALRAGTKKSNISRMESGRYNPSLDFLVKVADSMGRELSVEIK